MQNESHTFFCRIQQYFETFNYYSYTSLKDQEPENVTFVGHKESLYVVNEADNVQSVEMLRYCLIWRTKNLTINKSVSPWLML